MNIKQCLISAGLMLALFFGLSSCKQEKTSPVLDIIPKPVSMEREQGTFTIDPKTTLVLTDEKYEPSASFLNAYLKKYYNFSLSVKTITNNPDPNAKNVIVLGRQQMDYPVEGAYTLEANDNRVVINGDNAPGVFYGIQTLIQLLPTTPSRSLDIACVKINDYPRFKYRGMMLDCGRHFFDTAFVKRFIDFIALHKMNTFHWHLTEDQGWRIEIKKYPKLTEVGAWRDSTLIGHSGEKPYKFDHHRSGGFYTQEQIKDIVAYAKKRYITIIPEIEMPGHSMAAIAAYPELACQSGNYHVGSTWGVYDTILCPTPYTFNFYKNVLKEVMALFPSHYIHIGGDEAPKVTWENSAFCRQLIKKLGLKNMNQLQSYFIHTMEEFLNENGRDIIGWDEILEGGLAPNATVMSWRGEKGGIEAAKMHHNVIMTPTTYCYFDYHQSKRQDSLGIGGYLPLEKVYSYNPFPEELDSAETKYIQGVQANVWTEYMKWPSRVEFMIFPRMEAIAEVAWTPQKERNYGDFSNRLRTQFKRYDLWKVSYSQAIYEIETHVDTLEGMGGLTFSMSTQSDSGKIYYTTDGRNPTINSVLYQNPVRIIKEAHIRAQLFIDGKKVGPEVDQAFTVNKATGGTISLTTEPDKKYNKGGSLTLVDGEWPKSVSESSKWLGWNGNNMTAVIDLLKPEEISKVVVGIANSTTQWIYPPKSITVMTSVDGKNYEKTGEKTLDENDTAAIQKISIPVSANTRYVRVEAENFGTIPDGKPGGGHPAWLFVGEIGIE